MVRSHAEHVHSLCILLHSKCYCNIWHVFFCWHLFSLLFYVNKVLWDPGILLPPLLYPFEKNSNLLQDFLLVFKRASCHSVKCVVYELDSSLQVFLHLCHALVVGRLNVLFFFFFFFFFFLISTNPSPALLLREESSLVCYLTVGPKQVHKQKENRFADPARLTKKSSAWFRIRLRDSEVALRYFFQTLISNLRHQKSLKKEKKCKKVKVKAFFCSRRSNRRRLLSLLDRRSLLSRVRHWLNRDLEGSFVFLWESPALSFFRKCFLKKY